eukprot:Mycagemm_TRINITY_DN9445_c0_g1::TRINITY_DN9445_c0_g1_i1::g.3003::m.3003 type:complete len:143 gc:universal TRINITY_DN9445_c0_g1_i1:764-1192(+)
MLACCDCMAHEAQARQQLVQPLCLCNKGGRLHCVLSHAVATVGGALRQRRRTLEHAQVVWQGLRLVGAAGREHHRHAHIPSVVRAEARVETGSRGRQVELTKFCTLLLRGGEWEADAVNAKLERLVLQRALHHDVAVLKNNA